MNKFFEKLIKLQSNAYAHYSHFPVAAIVVCDDQSEFYGVNVENSSYGLTICAERNAIANAVTNGKRLISQIHILCGNGNYYASPCGACRQVIKEFSNDTTQIVLWNKNQEYKILKINELLPYGFDEAQLDGGRNE